MGLHIRDDRQMKALTGLSQAPCDSLRSVFSDLSRVTQQKTYEAGARIRHAKASPWGWGPREAANHGGAMTGCALFFSNVASR